MLTDTKKTLLSIGIGEAAMLWLTIAPDYDKVWESPSEQYESRVRSCYVVAAIAILSLAAVAEVFDHSSGSFIAAFLVITVMIAVYEFALYQPTCEGCKDD